MSGNVGTLVSVKLNSAGLLVNINNYKVSINDNLKSIDYSDIATYTKTVERTLIYSVRR